MEVLFFFLTQIRVLTSSAIFEPQCRVPHGTSLLHQSQHPGAEHTGQQELRLHRVLLAAAITPALQDRWLGENLKCFLIKSTYFWFALVGYLTEMLVR